ncbi:GNAT family N-acetyltransferase [Haloimpatiens sp. FM7330]|uniref:GNAT family N-acetyltransferase n=1 Tax=Haloimpatiens sp. FM7330 TaxID=3298610 RepID=UPI00362F4502
MDKFKLITDYKNNEKYRASFNELAIGTFGIDFEPWFQKGFWNENYICYSYVDGDKVISNISVNKLEIMWKGQKKKAVQIGTVMTHPDYRKKGLVSSLMKIVLDEYEKDVDFIYLFAADNALSLYLKFGFKPEIESTFSMELNVDKDPDTKLRKLDFSNKEDLNLIRKLASERTYISQKLGVKNDEHLILFYCLYVFSDNIYYLEEENTIVIFSIEDNELNLYDVLSKNSINIESIILKIASSKVKKVNFNFTPDLKFMKLEIKDLQKDDYTFLVKSLSVETIDKFLFSETSHA